MSKTISFFSRSDREHTLPAKWAICDNCRGEGKRDSFTNGITSSEWAEWDHDDRDYYMRGGYDVACQVCKGDGKILVVDEDACYSHRDQVLLKEYDRVERAMAEHERMRAAERRYGA